MPEVIPGKKEACEGRGVKRMPFPRNFFGGVCAGLAYYFGLPTWIVRFMMVVLACGGVGIVLYIVLFSKMPERERVPLDFFRVTGDKASLPCGGAKLEKRSKRFSENGW